MVKTAKIKRGKISFLPNLKTSRRYQNMIIKPKSGTQTFAAWYVLRANPKEIAERIKKRKFLKPQRKVTTPSIVQNTIKLASWSYLENCRCQGEMASKSDVAIAILLFLSKFNTRKQVKRTARVPKKAEGERTPSSFGPNNFMDGTRV